MTDTQHDGEENERTNTGAARVAPPPPSEVKRPSVYLDRSRDYSTAHGDRDKDDPHYGIATMQNGLPFNHQDELMFDHPMVQSNPKLMQSADRLATKAARLLARARSAEPDDDDDIEEGTDTLDDEPAEPVNLNAWARGIAEYQWQEVSNQVARKYGKRISNKFGAIELLLKEGAVMPGQLSKAHRAILDRGY